MHNSNQSPSSRKLFVLVLSIILATFILAGFREALAFRSGIISSGFLPLILRESGSPGEGTATPALTATPTRTGTPTKTTKPPPTPVAGSGKVLIVDMAFQPAELTVHVGEKVEWENKDLVSHTTTSNTGVWDSGELAPDEKFTFVFNSLGDFPYHCGFHPEMTGIIHVVPNP